MWESVEKGAKMIFSFKFANELEINKLNYAAKLTAKHNKRIKKKKEKKILKLKEWLEGQKTSI